MLFAFLSHSLGRSSEHVLVIVSLDFFVPSPISIVQYVRNLRRMTERATWHAKGWYLHREVV